MNTNKPWRPDYFEDLVHFLADPSDQRTIKEFAEAHGVTQDTIYLYKRKHGDDLWPCVDKVRAAYIPIIRQAAYAAIFKNIKSSFNDRRLAMQLVGDLIERSETKNTVITPEEKRARITELMEKLSSSVPNKQPKKEEVQ